MWFSWDGEKFVRHASEAAARAARFAISAAAAAAERTAQMADLLIALEIAP
jgi:hypothetical protein